MPWSITGCRTRAWPAVSAHALLFYQASGAFGFRDQLQDTLALLAHDLKSRDQILNAARR